MKINTQLLLNQSLLVILSVVIVLLNIVTFKNMESDSNFINHAGRLRFLNYKMAQISQGIVTDKDNILNAKEELLATINEYELLIDNLIEGCPIIKLKKLNHENTLEEIIGFRDVWYNSHKAYYERILQNNDIEAYEEINLVIFDHVNQIDDMVFRYSEFTENKISKAIFRNGLAIIIIMLVSGYSYTAVNKKVKIPMNKLLKELEDMDLIDDELAGKINLSNQDELAAMSSYIEELIYDGLTRTYNRRTGLSRLTTILENAKGNLHFSLVFIDVNGLKEVNDNLGHEYGDELLTLTVNVVKETIRNEDFIVRLGGDEFLLALENVDEENANIIWERILNRYKEINNTMNKPFMISVSHGIVEYENGSKLMLEDLIKIADKKMYEEKKRIKGNPEYKIIRRLENGQKIEHKT